MMGDTGRHGRSVSRLWRPHNPHACLPFCRRACLDDRACALLVPGTSPERPQSRPVSRPRGTKIDGGQRESENQPLAVPHTTEWCQRLLKIGTVLRLAPAETRPTGHRWSSTPMAVDFNRLRWHTSRCTRRPGPTRRRPRHTRDSRGSSGSPPRRRSCRARRRRSSGCRGGRPFRGGT